MKGFDAYGGRSDGCTENLVFALLRTPPHAGILLDGKHAEGASGTREDNLCALAYVSAGLSFNLCKWPHNAAFEPHEHVRHPADGLLTAPGVY